MVLPSELCGGYQVSSQSDDDVLEERLMEVLSSLASLDTSVHQPPSTQAMMDTIIQGTNRDNNMNNQWRIGLDWIHKTVIDMPPLSVHSAATQAIAFSESDQNLLALVLCVRALQLHPPASTSTSASASTFLKRWKRWQSVLCETIRQIQQHEVNEHVVSLWIEEFLKKLLDTKWLPPEALHLGIWAGIVGTTLSIIENTPLEMESDLLEALDLHMRDHFFTIIEQPWRKNASSAISEQGEQEGIHPLLLQHFQSQLSWWTCHANCHESVAHMDTSWSDVGVAVVAQYAWSTRALVHPNAFQWKTWFPHVQHLLLLPSTELQGQRTEQGLGSLKDLLLILPAQSQVPPRDSPLDPLSTFQALYQALLARRKSPAAIAELSSLIRQLLDKYIPSLQVDMVKRLIQNSPNPGLIPRHLDSLRPLVVMKEALPDLWSWLREDYVEPLSKLPEANEALQDLVDNVEKYVSVLTMVRLRLMVQRNVPLENGVMEKLVGGVLPWLTKKLKNFEHDDFGAPDGFFRLNLLQNSLEQITDVLNGMQE